MIKQLRLKNFRNITTEEIKFCEGINLFVGDNGQGKTNIIEALWLFCALKSFRNGRDRDFVNFQEENAAIAIDFETDRNFTIENHFSKTVKRRILINGIETEHAYEMLGHIRGVIFSPEHLSLVKDGPDVRRKFLDIAICQIKPSYYANSLKYRRILEQRNALLKAIKLGATTTDTLGVWNERLCEVGAYIIAARAVYVKRLCEKAKKIYSDITSCKECLDIRLLSNGINEEDSRYILYNEVKTSDIIPRVYKTLLDLVEKRQDYDIQTGTSHIGAHLDDLELIVNGRNSKLYASQGQQRSCVLSLKLAEADVIEEVSKIPPIVLLDDVLSELDTHRQEYILNHIENRQVFITCCDTEKFGTLKNGTTYHIENGKLM